VESLKKACANHLPKGWQIFLLAEYNPTLFPAPNLWHENQLNPNAKFLAILSNDFASVPALGNTIGLAILNAIAKIKREGLYPFTEQQYKDVCAEIVRAIINAQLQTISGNKT
jgi:hypothetical protein